MSLIFTLFAHRKVNTIVKQVHAEQKEEKPAQPGTPDRPQDILQPQVIS
jgi:hypothetical protein